MGVDRANNCASGAVAKLSFVIPNYLYLDILADN